MNNVSIVPIDCLEVEDLISMIPMRNLTMTLLFAINGRLLCIKVDVVIEEH